MKRRKLKNLENVCEQLGAKDVESLNDPRYTLEFLKLIPYMSKELALAVLEQCPQLMQITSEIVNTIERMFNELHSHRGSSIILTIGIKN